MSSKKDSPPRPKRMKKDQVIVISSSSDSDSDENVGVTGSRREKPGREGRMLSADDGIESSGNSVVSRRRVSRFSSDGSESNSSKCSICLLRFTSQKVGTPQSCEHIFCLDCILEWSKNVNTCPVDRKLFKSIVVRACAGGRVLRTQPVRVAQPEGAAQPERLAQPERVAQPEPVAQDEDSRFSIDDFDLPYCEVCRNQDREENMVLCQRCDDCYHLRCITPALGWVPYWFCVPCRSNNDGFIDEQELQDILDAEQGAINQNRRR